MLPRASFACALMGAVSLALSGATLADENEHAAPAVKLLKIIPVPPTATNATKQMKSFDISWVDADTQLYYLADRSNQAVDVVDARRNVFVRQIQAGFTGASPAGNDFSGPNGVVVIGRVGRQFLIVTDYPSRVFSIDLRTYTIADVVSTGGTFRTDELAYDPEDSLILAVNNSDKEKPSPFATLIHVDRDTGRLTVKQ